MLSLLKTWNGPVEVNGLSYDSIQQVDVSGLQDLSSINIKLYPKQSNPVQPVVSPVNYRITVRRYMTRKATPEFDFMSKWNNDVPMPFRTMVGTKEKETRGMVYMKLHGDIYADRIQHCMKCGKVITNPISQYFGMGPECGGHNYVNPFNSEQELKMAVQSYRKQLQEVVWEGWIIRSSILEEEVLDG